MTILIADDEEFIRFGILSMLEELDFPLDAVESVEDGEELLSRLAFFKPDIAFVDIRMPRVDGLTAIRRGKVLSPQTAWYILTSHPSFDYAREAVALGAQGYLLKPVSPEELAEALKAAAERSMAGISARNAAFENFLQAVLYNTVAAEDAFESPARNHRFYGVLIVLDGDRDESEIRGMQAQLCGEIRDRFSEFSDPSESIALVLHPAGFPAIVYAQRPPFLDAVGTNGYLRFSQAVRECVSAANPGISVTLFETDACGDFGSLVERLNRLSTLSGIRYLYEAADCFSFRAAERFIESDERIAAFTSSADKLVSACREGSFADFLKEKGDILNRYGSLEPYWQRKADRSLPRYVLWSLRMKRGGEIENRDLCACLEIAEAELVRKSAQGYGPEADLISNVIRYVDENFTTLSGIEELSDRFKLTPNYISSLFHKKTGTTFVKYVTRLKMAKARELLSVPGSRVYTVARQLGYSGTRHFTRLFKQAFNHTPSELTKTGS